MESAALFRDIAERTDGDIYLGVVGPVRTGKSTFIKRFMDQLVLPNIANEFERVRAVDELPQSAAGKTVMTTQPKFVPNDAVELNIDGTTTANIRLVDCVGYLVPGAAGHMENDAPRMVRTPWLDYDIPFEEAAEIGTHKVISEHSTIGVVVTTDGSITEIPREAYLGAEERVVRELKECRKPFMVIVNSTHPFAAETMELANALNEKYGVTARPIDAMNMTQAEINGLLEDMLMEFPLREIRVSIPEWMCALPPGHRLIKRIFEPLCACGSDLRMRDHTTVLPLISGLEQFSEPVVKRIQPGSGSVEYELIPDADLFYQVLGEECGCEIADDAQLVSLIKELVSAKHEYDRVASALDAAYRTGYGTMTPDMEDMQLTSPEVVQRGSRFGVKLNAHATGLHIIKVDINSEVAPVVGTREQAEEFMRYLKERFEGESEDMWQTNIFGKPLSDLIREDMASKSHRMPENVQQRLQSTVERMVNNGCNGLICIML